MSSQLKVLLFLRQKEGGGGVCYKHDGERFDHPHTLKLNQDTDYIITVQSPLLLRDLMIQGEKYELKEVRPETGKKSDDNLRFSAVFNTSGFAVEKRNNRKNVTVVLMFDGDVTLTTLLQCKFYPQSETDHSRWGNALSWIEYDCRLTEGQSGVLINKELFH